EALAVAAAAVAQGAHLLGLAVETGEHLLDDVGGATLFQEMADTADAGDVALEARHRILRGSRQHLHHHAAGRGDAARLAEHPQQHGGLGLLALREIVGDVLADLAAHQLDLALVAVALLVLAEHAEITPAHGAADAELAVRPIRNLHAAVPDDAAQVALVIRLGEDAEERTVSPHLQHQA